jgi:hypothetical protein
MIRKGYTIFGMFLILAAPSLNLETQDEINKLKSFITYTYDLKQQDIVNEYKQRVQTQNEELNHEIERRHQELNQEIETRRENLKQEIETRRQELNQEIETRREQFGNEQQQLKNEKSCFLETEIELLKNERVHQLNRELEEIKENERQSYQKMFQELLSDKRLEIEIISETKLLSKIQEIEEECTRKKAEEFLKIDLLAKEYSNIVMAETKTKIDSEMKKIQETLESKQEFYNRKIDELRKTYIDVNKKELAEANLNLELTYDKDFFEKELKEYKESREKHINNELEAMRKNYNEVLQSSQVELLEEQRQKRLSEHAKHKSELLTSLQEEIELKTSELYEMYTKELEIKKIAALEAAVHEQNYEIELLKENFIRELESVRTLNKNKLLDAVQEDNQTMEKQRIDYHNRQLENIKKHVDSKTQEAIDAEVKKIKEEKYKVMCEELEAEKSDKIIALQQKENEVKTRLTKMFFILHEAFGDIFNKDLFI